MRILTRDYICVRCVCASIQIAFALRNIYSSLVKLSLCDEKALALSTFLSLVTSRGLVDSIFENPKLKIFKILAASWHAGKITTLPQSFFAQRNNKKKMPSSSRNTSDSWVKKATGLSPGSMAPLSSAVNAAASAYGVGVLVFFGTIVPEEEERCACVGEKTTDTFFSRCHF